MQQLTAAQRRMSAQSPTPGRMGEIHLNKKMHNNATMNARRVKVFRLLLSVGLLITFLMSITLLAWHGHIIDDVPNQHPFFLHPHTTIASGDPSQLNGISKKPPDDWPPVLSAYMEPSSSTAIWYDDPSSEKPNPKAPLPMRHIRAQNLTRLMFPRISYTSFDTTSTICNNIPSLLPIDDFGSTIRDPYLPWIHDMFISHDGNDVNIVAQNRRRCHKGKFHNQDLKHWEGQVALFQPVAIKRVNAANNTNSNYNRDESVQYRLSTHKDADSDGIETRFLCRFKSLDYTQQTMTYQGETLSTYPFNYEFVNWRKQKYTMVEDGKEQTFFWLSPLMINCPIPTHLQSATNSNLLLDIIPIRTPTRRNDRDGFFFHKGHGGPMSFDAAKMWGENHTLPKAEDSGRWENLPVCGLKKMSAVVPKSIETDRETAGKEFNTMPTKKPHRLVACTWTSALHQRRGNERRITDGKARLREWIAFNLQVGFDHVYVFDNTGANATIFRLKNEVDPDAGDATSNGDQHRIHDDLSSVTDLFPPSQVTRIDWPATICNNNRPAHNDPGERSSQYAAEAACRTRYGPYTDWMASMDPDEYFVPMGNYTSWKEILDKVDKEEGRKVLKFRSTRARPLLSTLVPTYDEGAEECTHEMAKEHNQCLVKSEEKTYLETYNCEYIKSPKPERFARAMTDLATEKQHTKGNFVKVATTNQKMERFVDELEEGVLIHAKTTVPAETFSREKMCKLNAPSHCLVGIPCPDDLPFSDALHTKNVFHNEKGEFCNCWTNRKVEKYWLPKLNDELRQIASGS
ncbi:hypothetical protein ACHAXR_008612 [Thalassiosira sp. AJA248-18]